jgi:hypothetical protein
MSRVSIGSPTRSRRGNLVTASIGKRRSTDPLHMDCLVANCSCRPPEQSPGEPRHAMSPTRERFGHCMDASAQPSAFPGVGARSHQEARRLLRAVPVGCVSHGNHKPDAAATLVGCNVRQRTDIPLRCAHGCGLRKDAGSRQFFEGRVQRAGPTLGSTQPRFPLTKPNQSR